MKLSSIFVFFALSLIFKGVHAWWAAAARGIEPIILSFGAAFAALGLNDKSSHDLQLFRMGPIEKNNKILNESKKGNDPYLEKYLKDLDKEF